MISARVESTTSLLYAIEILPAQLPLLSHDMSKEIVQSHFEPIAQRECYRFCRASRLPIPISNNSKIHNHENAGEKSSYNPVVSGNSLQERSAITFWTMLFFEVYMLEPLFGTNSDEKIASLGLKIAHFDYCTVLLLVYTVLARFRIQSF